MSVTQSADNGVFRWPSDGQGGNQSVSAGNDTEDDNRVVAGRLVLYSTAAGTATITVQAGTPAVTLLSLQAIGVAAAQRRVIDFGGARLPPDLTINVAWTGGATEGVADMFYNSFRF